MIGLPGQLGTIVKWGSGLLIVLVISYGIKQGIDYHNDQIEKAVEAVKAEFALDKNEAIRKREQELKATAKVEKDIIEAELRLEKNRVKNLRRMLLIEHDLDQLLQKKPGLILRRVNEGTEAYFKELEDVTQ